MLYWTVSVNPFLIWWIRNDTIIVSVKICCYSPLTSALRGSSFVGSVIAQGKKSGGGGLGTSGKKRAELPWGTRPSEAGELRCFWWLIGLCRGTVGQRQLRWTWPVGQSGGRRGHQCPEAVSQREARAAWACRRRGCMHTHTWWALRLGLQLFQENRISRHLQQILARLQTSLQES